MSKRDYYEVLGVARGADKKEIKKEFTIITLKRFAIQNIVNPDKVEKRFFPSKLEERHIKKEWKKQKYYKDKNFNNFNILNFL